MPESSAPPADLVAALRAAGCVFAEDEARVLLRASEDPDRLAAALARRVAGEPLELIVGEVEFAGLRLRVAPGVFVPRTRTGLLVDVAVHALPPAGRLLDLCCGVGAVAAAVGTRRTDVGVVAADLDPVAVACARANLGGRGSVHLSDLYAALPPAPAPAGFDVIAANAPYVPSERVALMPREARDFEPRHTLDGGVDGAEVHRRIVAGAGAWLRPGGVLAIETARAAAEELAAVMAAVALVARVHVDDDRDATVVAGRAA